MLARDPFDVVEDRLAVQRLTHHDAALPSDADRAIAEQMPKQTREGQGSHASRRRIEAETQFSGLEHVAGLVRADLVERGFESDHHAVLPQHQLVRALPAPMGAQDLVVRCAHQRPAILEHQ